MKIEIKILNKEFYHQNVGLPQYATSGSAAMDLYSTGDTALYPGECKKIKTGIAIHIGSNAQLEGDKYITTNWSIAGMIVPRSGLGTQGLVLANTIGIIDEDYQGEIIISAWNRKPCHNINRKNKFKIEVKAGDRIAQLMFVPVVKATWDVVEEFTTSTERGDGGYGSTGV